MARQRENLAISGFWWTQKVSLELVAGWCTTDGSQYSARRLEHDDKHWEKNIATLLGCLTETDRLRQAIEKEMLKVEEKSRGQHEVTKVTSQINHKPREKLAVDCMESVNVLDRNARGRRHDG
ncbi:hypothetical protein Syun_006096 [Stephania yunnanensis]|uniref:Uncharacterized protein n=1 Tax=Stephania yunnanensis TaxID=152371 RepID=A0AAP0KX07_9MAGN